MFARLNEDERRAHVTASLVSTLVDLTFLCDLKRMVYLIGGASRAGKTTLAQRLLSDGGVPWFSLDVLRVGLCRTFPERQFNSKSDDLEEADRLWPLVRAMSECLIETSQTQCFEGVCLRPKDVAELLAEFPNDASACFLGYPNILAERKIAQVRAHSGGINDWLSDRSAQIISNWVKLGTERSRLLEKECRANGIAFVDTGAAFEQALSAAEQLLLHPPTK